VSHIPLVPDALSPSRCSEVRVAVANAFVFGFGFGDLSVSEIIRAVKHSRVLLEFIKGQAGKQ
jgi:hypothetical protein